MLNDLLLLSGVDIPFSIAQLSIHQPTIKEISYAGEQNFFTGCEVLRFSKNKLTAEDKANLTNQTDFDIIMSILKDRSNAGKQNSLSAQLVLLLMFPNYQLQIKNDRIVLFKVNDNNERIEERDINNENYLSFKEILINMFCLKEQEDKEYNPGGDYAQRIADKLRKGKAKVAKQRGTNGQQNSLLSKYVSILAVGEHKDMNELMNYTIYQLFDEFQRFQLRENYDIYLRAKLAGAKDLKDVDNWMDDIHNK